MAGVRFDVFKGIRPRVAHRLLPAGEARTAQNVALGSGHLEPLNGHTQIKELDSTLVGTIYRMRNNGAPKWLQFTTAVDIARGPILDDDLERTYYAGGDLTEPRMTYTTIVGSADPLPQDYRKLGIPAPSTAPTVAGDAVPEDVVTGTVTAFSTPNLKADFTIDQNLPNNVNSWYMALTEDGVPSDNGYEPSGTKRTFRFNFPVGLELRVASVVDTDTITVEDANNGDYVAAGVDNTRSGQTWWRTEDTGTTRAGFFRFYLPNGIKLTIANHGLQEGDVIRVTSVSTPIGITFTAPDNVTTFGGHFFGWESDNGAGDADTNTWPSAPVSVGADAFYRAGATAYPFVDIWVDNDGASSVNSFDIDGQFSYQLIERDGVSYNDIATNIESRVYVYTFVSELGEEGPPSPASDVVTIPVGGEVVVGTFETPPTDKRSITAIRIYRANTGSQVTEFQFVAEIGSPFSDYTDSIAAIDLGEVLQTETWEPPPAALEGLVTLPNGGMAGFVGKTVYFCEPYFPHAWPPEYKVAVDHDIVGLGVLPNGLAILTTGAAYLAAGDHPRSMSLRHFTASQACTSKRSIVSTIDSVIYASPDGLASIGAAGFQLLTKGHVGKEEWQQFDPTNVQGFWHDSKYYGFHSTGGFIFDPFDESVGWTTLDWTIECGFLDPEEDTLYAVLSSDLLQASFAVTVAKHPNQNTYGFGPSAIYGVTFGTVDPNPVLVDSAVGQVQFLSVNNRAASPNWLLRIDLSLNGAPLTNLPANWHSLAVEYDGGTVIYPLSSFAAGSIGPTSRTFERNTETVWDSDDIGKTYTVTVLGGSAFIYALFADSADSLELTWRSGDVVLPYPLNPAAARIVADTYPVEFNLYDAAGTLRATRMVANSNVFRLPGGYTTDALSVEVVASSAVRMIHVAETVEELYQG